MLHRKTGNLRIGRVSIAGAAYFVSVCTSRRQPFFSDAATLIGARLVLQRLVDDGDCSWLAATIMPDHVHLLFSLGVRLPFDQCVAKFKG